MADMAEKAGVAVQTLYLAFGSKAAILAEVHDLAVVGANENIPCSSNPGWPTCAPRPTACEP